jgi:serine/threonine-protein kinase
LREFLQELKRRNVFRVTIAYVMLAWIVAQVAQLALESFESPAWVIKTLLLLLALGLPFAIFFSWAFELTPEGLKKEKDVDRGRSITPSTGRKLDRTIIALLSAVVIFFVVDRFVLDRAEQDVSTGQGGGVSIAVLPFVNMSNDADQEYFSDGVSEELLNLLAKIPQFQVAGRTSSFVFKGHNQNLREIGEDLGVDNILEGSVRKSDDRVRITAQLIKVSDGFHLWSETYDRTLDDIFAVQDDIANEVVDALKIKLLGGNPVRPASQFGIDNAQAYNAYLKGLFFYNKSGADNLEKAAQQMQEAVALAPESALAWSGLARALEGFAGQSDSDPVDLLARAREAVQQALALDAELPEAQLADAEMKYNWDWDWAGADAALNRALTLRPAYLDAQLLRASLLQTFGELEQVERITRDALAQDPLNDRLPRLLLATLYHSGRFDEAAEIGERLLNEDPNMPFVRAWLASIYVQRGQIPEALQQAQQEPVMFARQTVTAIAQHVAGNQDAAAAAQQQLLETYGDLAAFQQAQVFTYWGETDMALDWLDRAYQQRDPGILVIKTDLALSALREHPRFVSILRKMNLAD